VFEIAEKLNSKENINQKRNMNRISRPVKRTGGVRNKINTKTSPPINTKHKTPKTPTPKFKTVEITLNRENSIHQIAQELRNPPAESHTNQSEI